VSGEPQEPWVSDPVIRALVADNTPCYGTYSPAVPVCGKCPLKAHCAGALAVGLQAIARALVEEAEETARRGATLMAATANAARALTNTTGRQNVTSIAAKVLKVQYDGALCSRTGRSLTKGTECLYVAGTGLVGIDAATDEERGALATATAS